MPQKKKFKEPKLDIFISKCRKNRNLFSNYYLDNLIKNIPEWSGNEHVDIFEKIKKIFKETIKKFGEREIKTVLERQLERYYYEKIFDLILPFYEVQEPTKEKTNPDYVFFQDKNVLERSHKDKGTKSFFVNSLTVGEVKRWEIKLDRIGKDRYNRRVNPSFQLWLYLHETKRDWGILTNGKKWRLYHKTKPFDCFFEVDLEEIIKSNSRKDFRFFYYFFRMEAFQPYVNEKSFVDYILKESQIYAQDIGENLKENVYKSMKIIADGFFHWTANGLDPSDKETRIKVRKVSMRLLYRILFFLFAEGKGLLDVKSSRYRDMYSFLRIKEEIARKKVGPISENYSLAHTTIWNRLKDLTRLINDGSESFSIPRSQFFIYPYNGGLFSPIKNPNLENWVIADPFLADAIDCLTRSKINGKVAFIDYSTLQIRHLGSIYEGLLEYRLKLAEKDMVVISRDRRRVWVSLEEYNTQSSQKKKFSDFSDYDRVKTGELYLSTDKGDRKLTGSYYTPDYIVSYIIEKTVGKKIEEKWIEAEKEKKGFIESTLSLNVLDPAMGSGHFLIGVVEFMAAKLMEAAQKDIELGYINDGENLTIDLFKREVVSKCIYGVDSNDLAVELAKVSLWLTTISTEYPLNFLDHKLKQGDSLIGVGLKGLTWHPTNKEIQKMRIDIPEGSIDKLVNSIQNISKISDDTLDNIKTKIDLYQKSKETIEYNKIKLLADYKTSIYFNNPINRAKYEEDSRNILLCTKENWNQKKETILSDINRNYIDNNIFFHWELEFPDIFLTEGKNGENLGFDVVLGNPPYIVMENMSSETRDYCYGKNVRKIKPYRTAHRKTNMYALFLEKAELLTRQNGFFGFITPYSWITEVSFYPLREILLLETSIQEITLFPLGVFDEADIDTSILVVKKAIKNENTIEARDFREHLVSELPDSLRDDSNVKTRKQKHYLEFPGYEILLNLPDKEYSILSKITNNSEQLVNICKIQYGCKAANIEKYINNTKEGLKNPKKLLQGKDIRRNFYQWGGIYIDYLPEEMKRERSTSRPGEVERFDVDEKLIVYIFLRNGRYVACYDSDQYYSLNSTFLLQKLKDIDLKIVLAQINSLISSYFTSKFFSGAKIVTNKIEVLPILDTNVKELIEAVDDISKMKQEIEDEKRRFIDWLRRTYKANNELCIKIAQEIAVINSFDAFYGIVSKNDDLIKIDVTSRTFQEQLQREWDKYHAIYSSNTQNINNQERKIDIILFKLYQLEKEEVIIILDSLRISEEEKNELLQIYDEG